MASVSAAPQGHNQPRMVPSRVEQTNQQIHSLLAIHSTVLQTLMYTPERDQLETGKPGTALDGGVISSAETTYINVCNRLDELLTDPTRWKLDTMDKLETALQGVYESQATLNKESERVTTLTARPHVFLRPKVVQLASGEWVAAISGDPGSLRGYGLSPAEAMLEFDRNYFQKSEIGGPAEVPPKKDLCKKPKPVRGRKKK